MTSSALARERGSRLPRRGPPRARVRVGATAATRAVVSPPVAPRSVPLPALLPLSRSPVRRPPASRDGLWVRSRGAWPVSRRPVCLSSVTGRGTAVRGTGRVSGSGSRGRTGRRGGTGRVGSSTDERTGRQGLRGSGAGCRAAGCSRCRAASCSRSLRRGHGCCGDRCGDLREVPSTVSTPCPPEKSIVWELGGETHRSLLRVTRVTRQALIIGRSSPAPVRPAVVPVPLSPPATLVARRAREPRSATVHRDGSWRRRYGSNLRAHRVPSARAPSRSSYGRRSSFPALARHRKRTIGKFGGNRPAPSAPPHR